MIDLHDLLYRTNIICIIKGHDDAPLLDKPSAVNGYKLDSYCKRCTKLLWEKSNDNQ